MKANELRIGNLCIEENNGEIIEVIGLEKKRIVFSGMFLEKWQAKPIPLTEEWKEKLKDTPIYTDGEGFIIFKGEYHYAFIWQDYPFLHQLQNLYFALIGEELGLK